MKTLTIYDDKYNDVKITLEYGDHALTFEDVQRLTLKYFANQSFGLYRGGHLEIYYPNSLYDSMIRANKQLSDPVEAKAYLDKIRKYPILYNSIYGGINMIKSDYFKWVDVNNTRYKVASIMKSVDKKHFDLIIYKDLSYLNMKGKVARLEVYFSQHENDYVMSWSGYDHGFTGELIEFVNKLIKHLKENLFLKDDRLESVTI